ncbi:glycosyltransferase family 2 protein [Bacillus sp. 22-7]|uniref:glycosyltransferase family 2 protein n=1 Tax=Bacillus sp. 22-7 TaxID=2709707 RepID=UPI0013D2DE40|nr:glycosyltransferase family 2 protein [Bacillus sp. 22-7]
MVQISACVITKNEEKNIERSIQSYKEIADEIILVDTGSLDRTIDIADKHGAKIYHYDWDNNFAKAKNFALSKASGEWIVFLDADEYFDKETANLLPNVLNQINSNKLFDALNVKMIHTDGYNGRVISENPAIRIFRNRKSIRFIGSIHEKPMNNGSILNALNPSNLHLKIFHTGYKVGENLIAKFKRNLVLLEKQLESNEVDGMTYYYLSATHSSLGNHELAIKYGYETLKNNQIFESLVAHKPYVFIIKGMLELYPKYSLHEIRTIMSIAIDKFFYHPEIIRLRADLYKKLSMYDEAISDYLTSLEMNDEFNKLLLNDFYMYKDVVYQELGNLMILKKKIDSALQYFLLSLKENKYNQESLLALINISHNINIADFIYLINTIYHNDSLEDMGFLVKFLSQLKSEAVIYYQEIWNKKFEKEDLTIVITLLILKRFEEAYNLIFDLLRKHQVEQLEIFLFITCLVLDKKEYYKDTLKVIKDEELCYIIKCLLGKEDYNSTSKDTVINIIRELCLLKEDQAIELLLNKLTLNKKVFFENIGNLYFNIRKFEEAQIWFNKTLKSNVFSNERDVLFKLGVCYYQLNDKNKAYINFIKAQNLGYNKEDLNQYYIWLLEI